MNTHAMETRRHQGFIDRQVLVDGGSKFLRGHCSRASLHDNDTPCVIGEPRSFLRRPAAGKSQSEDGNDRVARPGNVRNFIAPENRDMGRGAARLQQRHAEAALSNQKVGESLLPNYPAARLLQEPRVGTN